MQKDHTAEEQAEGMERAHEASHAHHVCADFPPGIDDDADDLCYQGCHDHSSEEHGGVHLCHEHQACAVAQQGEHVWHVAVFAVAQFHVGPLLHCPH